MTDDHVKCLASLRPSNNEDYRDKIAINRHDSTCTWILQDEHYKQWKEQHSPSVLWINGDPGCGKSVLASFLVTEISQGKVGDCTLAFFFCKDTDERLNTAHAILVNWLAQLLRLVPRFIEHFSSDSTYSVEKDKTKWTPQMLWRVLVRIILDPYAGNICLLVDALGKTPYISFVTVN